MGYLRGATVSAKTKIPTGHVVVHNHVKWLPGTVLGERGFRAWTQVPSDSPELVLCKCGWAAEVFRVHYRVKRIAK